MNKVAYALPDFIFLIASISTSFYGKQKHSSLMGLRIFSSSFMKKNWKLTCEPMAYCDKKLDMHMPRKMHFFHI